MVNQIAFLIPPSVPDTRIFSITIYHVLCSFVKDYNTLSGIVLNRRCSTSVVLRNHGFKGKMFGYLQVAAVGRFSVGCIPGVPSTIVTYGDKIQVLAAKVN